MNRKENSLFQPCHSSGTSKGCNVQKPHDSTQMEASEKLSKTSMSSSQHLKFSEKCVNDDSRLSDSGVWSGSNIHSEELTTPESPYSRSSDFTYSSEKVSNDKQYTRLDSGIDVSVSQHFNDLSLKDCDTNNDLNESPSKSKLSTSSKININDQFTLSQSVSSQYILQKQAVLEKYFKPDEDGDTDLHLAIIHKFIEGVFALVRMIPHPKYLNIKNKDHQTPLHLAVLTRQPRLVRLLVCSGAAVDTLDRYGNTALHLAVQGEDLPCVRAILDPVTITETLAIQLQFSPYQFHTHKDIANIYNYEGQTCLHLAALNGNIEIFQNLIWVGANINAREWKGGYTCLHLAVERKDTALCLFLLNETKIDPEETSYAGHTAYQNACGGWDMTITEVLRNHGVDTYIDSDSSDSDDDMLDISEVSFNTSFQMNGSGLINVGA